MEKKSFAFLEWSVVFSLEPVEWRRKSVSKNESRGFKTNVMRTLLCGYEFWLAAAVKYHAHRIIDSLLAHVTPVKVEVLFLLSSEGNGFIIRILWAFLNRLLKILLQMDQNLFIHVYTINLSVLFWQPKHQILFGDNRLTVK